MKNLIRQKLLPLRRMAGRFAIQDYGPIERSLRPIYLAADFVCSEYVPGDYLEFGVSRRASFVTAYNAISSAVKEWNSKNRAYQAYTDVQRAEQAYTQVTKNDIRFFAFDSFDGLPEPAGIDKLEPRYSNGRYDCSEDEFKTILTTGGVDLSQVITVPGFYEDSLTPAVKTQNQMTAASIVMVDCDLYESTKTVLEFITPLVVEGTVIIFDDWFNFKANPGLGEQRACSEWLEANPGLKLTPFARWGMSQQAVIVHKLHYH
jgi:hypothetical protein